MKALGLLYIISLNIILMLIFTLVIASLTLLERKILALVQRRVGPYFVGYKGRMQYIADALKLLLKKNLIPSESNNFFFLTIPTIICALCYTIWTNSIWGPNISLFDIEYNLIYSNILSILFSFCIVLTGFFSKNKYAMLGSVRAAVLTLNLEIFLGLLILNVVLISESFCFSVFSLYQEFIWLFIPFFPIIGLVVIIFLLETNRAPFDLAEAEAELVCGYHTEYGGFLFALYYLGEYFHLFFFSTTIVILFFGSWELPNCFFLFFKYYDMFIFEFSFKWLFVMFLLYFYINFCNFYWELLKIDSIKDFSINCIEEYWNEKIIKFIIEFLTTTEYEFINGLIFLLEFVILIVVYIEYNYMFICCIFEMVKSEFLNFLFEYIYLVSNFIFYYISSIIWFIFNTPRLLDQYLFEFWYLSTFFEFMPNTRITEAEINLFLEKDLFLWENFKNCKDDFSFMEIFNNDKKKNIYNYYVRFINFDYFVKGFF